MKKLVSLLLVMSVILSMSVVAFADENTDDYTNGTAVIYGDDDDEIAEMGTQAYEITVPALMSPGESGTVAVTGTWASVSTLTVSASETVEMQCNLSDNSKTLAVTFAGIESAGSDIEEMSLTAGITVADWSEAVTAPLFGEWSGTITYTAAFEDGLSEDEG